MPNKRRRSHTATNLERARQAWRRITAQARTFSHVRGRDTAGTDQSEYYQIEVRPKDEFIAFRTRDVGDDGSIQKVSGKRSSGDWNDQKWLISKLDAHIEGRILVPDSDSARELLEQLGSTPVYVDGDLFRASPGDTDSEVAELSPAQIRAERASVRKALSGQEVAD